MREDCTATCAHLTTTNDVVHSAASGVAFLALLAAPLMLARPFGAAGWPGLAAYSRITTGTGSSCSSSFSRPRRARWAA